MKDCLNSNFLFFLLISVICHSPRLSYAQSIAVTDTSELWEIYKDQPARSLEYLPKKFLLPEDSYLGTVEITIKSITSTRFSDLFQSFVDQSVKLGANSFRIENIFRFRDKEKQIVEISIHRVTDEQLSKALSLYPKNLVYIIGDLEPNSRAKKLRLNDEKRYLPPYRYIVIQNQVGQQTKINVGGLTGATIWIKAKEGRLPVFNSLSNFGAGLVLSPGGGTGMTFNTGRIYGVSQNFGQFIIRLIPELQQIKDHDQQDSPDDH